MRCCVSCFLLCFKTDVDLLFSFELCNLTRWHALPGSTSNITCYFLLNYAKLIPNSFLTIAEDLLFSFELCVSKKSVGKHMKSYLAIFFWIMQASKPNHQWTLQYIVLPCYFLLNYAIVYPRTNPANIPIPPLLFSFELCTKRLQRLPVD